MLYENTFIIVKEKSVLLNFLSVDKYFYRMTSLSSLKTPASPAKNPCNSVDWFSNMNLQSIFYDCNKNTDMKPFPKDDRG